MVERLQRRLTVYGHLSALDETDHCRGHRASCGGDEPPRTSAAPCPPSRRHEMICPSRSRWRTHSRKHPDAGAPSSALRKIFDRLLRHRWPQGHPVAGATVCHAEPCRSSGHPGHIHGSPCGRPRSCRGVMLACRTAAFRGLTHPLAVVGRTALTNHLPRTIFCGHGLGLVWMVAAARRVPVGIRRPASLLLQR